VPDVGGPGRSFDVEARLEAECGLAPGATRSHPSGRRVAPESPDPLRTCFERDRDRILHSPAFRRLAGKTQVFVFPSDHQRTRLTHALEVAQVATAVARACRLNEALTEAIALGHDCGHGPGGHASEDALGDYLPHGFDHAPWGADVVLAPLNLCAETLDGIRNHSWSRPAPSTPEGEVVAWADRIAYVCHDFEDAVQAGIVASDELPGEVAARCGARRSSQLHTFITALVDTTVTTGAVGFPDDLADVLAAFRTFNYERIYARPASVAQADRVGRLLRALVDHLVGHPELLPDREEPTRTGDVGHGAAAATDPLVLAAVRHVAGMTDRYACQLAIRELGWSYDDLPRGIDLFG
jgi:dGTPase